MEMALLIEEALQKNTPAVVEAGTGTGKTFGYLAPIVLSGKKAVISTGTKNLQEQVYFKDIPLLEKAASINTNAMIMKGRKNYLCLHRYHQFFAQSSFLKTGLGQIKKRLDKWMVQTEFGDRAELAWLADDNALWDALSASSEQCLGGDCMFLEDCFLNRLRARAARSSIIIVNHYLFFADLKVKKGGFGEVIPRFQVALFDEAHSVEEIATTYLGESLSTNQLAELADDIEKGLKDLRDGERGKINRRLLALRGASETLKAFLNSRGEKGKLDREALEEISQGPARAIKGALRFIQEKSGLEELDHISLQPLIVRAGELNQLLDNILIQRDPNWLNWYERRKKSVVLHASPLDISERLKALLYDKVQTVIFTSATLSTNKTLDYFRSRLGLPRGALEGIHPSHFDFKTQSLLYIPRDLPDPREAEFAPAIAVRIGEILKRTQGRALVLFTSYHNLNLVHQILHHRIPYTLYRQGDAPRSVLLEAFRRDIHSVLLATGSFWQGVDVPGEALSCLVIDKLPFDSPTEPLVAARIDAIQGRGGDPFLEYQVPSAIISLKQGLGRLIRKTSDRGILSILDIRILTSRYGRSFLESMPEFPLRYELSDISRFFENR
jgi:ATP-dependent DNA helicase DinG